MSADIIELRPTGPIAPTGPDDWRMVVMLDALFAILNDAHDLDHARQFAGEAIAAATEGDAA